MTISEIFQAIQQDPQNQGFTTKGLQPLYQVDASQAKILLITQAPSRKAQETMTMWADASGDRLRSWLGVTKAQFYQSGKIAILPLDFYYPGKRPHGGDLPPRPDFATKWHPQLLQLMPQIELTILVGRYAQIAYLKHPQRNVTATVRHYQDYLPTYWPIIHPSPLNRRWQQQHPWFITEVVPALRRRIATILA